MSCREASLTISLEFPFELAACSVQTIKIAVVAFKKHGAARNSRRAGDAAFRFEFPFESSGSEVNRIKIVIAAADVNRIATNHRRREHGPLRPKLPLHFVKLRHARRIENAGARGVRMKMRILRVNHGNYGECGSAERNRKGELRAWGHRGNLRRWIDAALTNSFL